MGEIFFISEFLNFDPGCLCSPDGAPPCCPVPPRGGGGEVPGPHRGAGGSRGTGRGVSWAPGCWSGGCWGGVPAPGNMTCDAHTLLQHIALCILSTSTYFCF